MPAFPFAAARERVKLAKRVSSRCWNSLSGKRGYIMWRGVYVKKACLEIPGSYDESNELSCTLHGDYYLPDFVMNEEEPILWKIWNVAETFFEGAQISKIPVFSDARGIDSTLESSFLLLKKA